MRPILITLLVVFAIGAAWYVGTRGTTASPLDLESDASFSLSSDDSALASNLKKTVRSQGKLVPASGLINIVASPGERISKLIEKKIGETVKKDEVLVTLQSRLLREKDLALAKARRSDAKTKAAYETGLGKYRLDSARLALAEAESSDEKIATESRQIELLHHQLAAAKAMSSRMRDIQSSPATKDLINRADIEKQELMVEQLRLQIEQANLEVELAGKSAARAKQVAHNNLKTVEFSLANADSAIPLKSLDATVALAEQAFEMTQIRSPIDNATILDIIVREGDSVTNQPIMILGDTSQMYCVTEINDMLLKSIDLKKHNNLRARITSSALAQPLLGTVVAKGVMVGPPSMKDPNPFASVDRRTIAVTIKLDDSEPAARLVNLQVEVEIELEPGALNTSRSD